MGGKDGEGMKVMGSKGHQEREGGMGEREGGIL